MKNLTKRLTSLLLVLAMALSLSCSAFASSVEGDTSALAETSAPAAEPAEETPAEEPAEEGEETPAETPAEAPESVDPADESTAPETDPADAGASSAPAAESTAPAEESTAPETDPADAGASSAPAAESADPAAESADPAAESAAPVEENAAPVEESVDPVEETPVVESVTVAEEALEPMAVETSGWKAVLKSGVTTATSVNDYDFVYKLYANNNLIIAKGGAYSLPEQAISFPITVGTTTTTGAVLFKTGIYYFNVKGNLSAPGTATEYYGSALKNMILVEKTESNGDTKYQYASSKPRVITIKAPVFTEARDNVYIVGNPGVYFTGNFLNIHKNKLMYKVTNGVAALFTGIANSRYYVKGVLASGGYAYYGNRMYTVSASGVATLFTGVRNSRYYVKGVLTGGGYIYYGNRMYAVSASGVATLFTGIVPSGTYAMYYVSNGVVSTSTRWVKVGKNYYFMNKGKAVTGYNYVSKMSSSGGKLYSASQAKGKSTVFKYYFSKTGVLQNDLFKVSRTNYSRKMIVKIYRSTHNATIYLYDTTTGTYCIPAKTFIVSTSKSASNTAYVTGYISKRLSWFIFKGNSTVYYQWGTRLAGSPSYLHSEQYSSKNRRTLRANSYNGLGTNQSKNCVRAQVCNARLLYDCVGKQGSGKVKFQFLRASVSDPSPYGKITLASTTGKISTSRKTDPTDVQEGGRYYATFE